MVATAQIPVSRQKGDGITTVFSVPFFLEAASDLRVTFLNTTTDIQTPVPSGFTVDGPFSTEAGFQVTFSSAPAADVRVTFRRLDAVDQELDLRDGVTAADAQELALDELARIMQYVLAEVSRRAGVRESSRFTVQILEPIAGRPLIWQSVNAITNEAVIGPGAAASGPSADTFTVQISAADTIPASLQDSLVAGANITLTLLNPGANEQLQITAAVAGASTASPVESILTGGPPVVVCYRDVFPPVNGNDIGHFNFDAEDSASGRVTYAQIRGIQTDITAGLEDGTIGFYTMIDGTLTNIMTVGNGVIVGAPTGTYRGPGTLNAEALYVNGVLVQSSATAPLVLSFPVVGGVKTAMSTARRFPGYGDDGTNGCVFGGDNGANVAPLAGGNILDPAAAAGAGAWNAMVTGSPYVAVSRPAVASYAGDVYAFGGFTAAVPTLVDTVQRYDMSADAWLAVPPVIPLGIRAGAAAAVDTAGIVCVMGGSILAASITNRNERFNAVTQLWTVAGAVMPGSRKGGVLFHHSGSFFYLGGTTGVLADDIDDDATNATDQIWIYDLSADRWYQSGKTMPYPLAHASVRMINGIAVIFGGVTFAAGAPNPDIWAFDPTTLDFYKIGEFTAGGYGAAAYNLVGSLWNAGGDGSTLPATSAVTATGAIAASAVQTAPASGMRMATSPASLRLVNITTGQTGRMIGVRQADQWQTLPTSVASETQEVTRVGQSDQDGGAFQEGPAGFFSMLMNGVKVMTWDQAAATLHSNGEIVDALP